MSEIRKPRKRFISRPKLSAKFQLPKDANIDYKNLSLIQKYVNDRGKLVPRRISGVTAKGQRQITIAIKRARFMALLITGGVKKS